MRRETLIVILDEWEESVFVVRGSRKKIKAISCELLATS